MSNKLWYKRFWAWILLLFIDPTSNQPSMSRTLLPWIILLDAMWVLAVCYHIPKDSQVGPVCSMLGIITGAVCGIYGLSTFGGSISSVVAQWGGGTSYPGGTAPKAVRAVPKEGQG